MMFGQGGPVKVFVATRPVDFRKGIDGLALAVQEMFGMDPFCGAVFVFRSKLADRIKLLMWDQTGMVLLHKRLEDGKFVWPQVRDGVMRMSSAQMAERLVQPATLGDPERPLLWVSKSLLWLPPVMQEVSDPIGV